MRKNEARARREHESRTLRHVLAACLAAAALTIGGNEAGAQITVPPGVANEAAPLLAYCAPPAVPACVDVATTYSTTAASNACRAKVDAYVTTVFRYRACLARETDRAVLETNQTLARFRCALGRKKPCPPTG